MFLIFLQNIGTLGNLIIFDTPSALLLYCLQLMFYLSIPFKAGGL